MGGSADPAVKSQVVVYGTRRHFSLLQCRHLLSVRLGLLLEDQADRLLGEVTAGKQPLVVLLDQERSDQTDCRGVVGEDADDVRATGDLLVDALDVVGGAQLRPVGLREAVEGEEVLLRPLPATPPPSAPLG